MDNLSEKQVEQYASLIAKRIETIEGDWKKPWIDSQAGIPQNIEGRPYRGLNSLVLGLDTSANNYTYPVYMTFLKAKEEGIRINAGEKGMLVSFVGKLVIDKEDGKKISYEDYKNLSLEDQDKYKLVPFLRISPVFNLDQTNIKEVRPDLWEKTEQRLQAEVASLKRDDSFKHPALNHMIEGNNWIIPILHSQEPRAYYAPERQIIHLPDRGLFHNNESYYATALHEMAHSTEVPLKREIITYAREELVAELSASIAANYYSYPKTIQDNNIQYLKSWLQNMKESPDFLKEVLEDVHRASNFITKEIDMTYEKSLNQEEKVLAEIHYTHPSGQVETVQHTNEDKFIQALSEAWDVHGPSGVQYNLIEPSQEFKERVDQAKVDFFGPLDKEEPILSSKAASQEEEEKERQEGKIALGATIYEKELEDKGLFRMYTNPQLMTLAYLEEHKIDSPQIVELVKEREKVLEDYRLKDDPSLLVEKEQLEDRIRAVSGELYSIPSLPSREQKEDYLTKYIEYITQDRLPIEASRLVHEATYNDISIVVKEPFTPDKYEKLEREGVDFQHIADTLHYEARIRYREGFTMPNTNESKELLESLNLRYTPYGMNKLFISSNEENLGSLTYHTDKIEAIYGIGTLPKLKESSLEQRISSLTSLKEEEKSTLREGKPVFKEDDSKVYYIDRQLNQIRTIDSKDIFVPKEITGISLSDEQRSALRSGKELLFFDQENHVYHRAQLDFNEHNNIYLEYRTSLSDRFKSIPTLSSPDHEKEQYIAAKGAKGIDDIWGKEGVKLERESFLERYQVHEAYREYLHLKQLGEPGNSVRQNEEIKLSFQEERMKSPSISR